MTGDVPAKLRDIALLLEDTASLDAVDRALGFVEVYNIVRVDVLPAIAALRREAVRELRAQGLTYKDIGEQLGVSHVSIVRMVNQ